METDFAVPHTQEDLVYRGDRYVKGTSPYVIYYPSKLMLFKLMRACIGVEREEDLWFWMPELNHASPDIREMEEIRDYNNSR